MPERIARDAVPKDLTLESLESNVSASKDLMWSSILTGYSSAQLTKPEDKEVALFGVIKVLEERFKDKYVAGLWASTLLRQLAWGGTDPNIGSTNKRSRQAQRAPSWSCQFSLLNLLIIKIF